MLITGQLTTTLAIGMPGPVELLIILAIGLLIFGRRLPEVGRSLGKSIVEFKRGVRDIQNEIEDESVKPTTASAAPPAQIDAQEGVQVQGSTVTDADAVQVKPENDPDAGAAPPASA